MRRSPRSRSISRSPARRGVAALFVLFCLSFATIVATLLVKAAVAERTNASRLASTYEANWLVEAGIDRAAAQLGRSRAYTGETWRLSAEQLAGSRGATVRIEVKPDADPKFRRVTVTAALEGTSGTTVQATKAIRISS